MARLSGLANGTIGCSTLVVIDTTTGNAFDQATGNAAFLIGVSQEYADTAPIPGVTTTNAAVQGEVLAVYSVGEICLLNASTAGWTAGDRLTANASGQGVTASGTQYYGAIARTTLSGAGLGWVEVILGKNP
jgi:hypothetical protein